MLALAALVVADAGVASSPPPVYAVTRIGSDISDDQLVGVKRAGLACLPDGSIRWGDVSTGTNMDQRELVQDVIEDAGLPVLPLGETSTLTRARRVVRVRGAVREASFKLCARHWGLGDAKAMSGTVHFQIEWRAESRDDATAARHVTAIDRTIDGAHAVPLGALYRGLLKEAARDLAAWLPTAPAP